MSEPAINDLETDNILQISESVSSLEVLSDDNNNYY